MEISFTWREILWNNSNYFMAACKANIVAGHHSLSEWLVEIIKWWLCLIVWSLKVYCFPLQWLCCHDMMHCTLSIQSFGFSDDARQRRHARLLRLLQLRKLKWIPFSISIESLLVPFPHKKSVCNLTNPHIYMVIHYFIATSCSNSCYA